MLPSNPWAVLFLTCFFVFLLLVRWWLCWGPWERQGQRLGCNRGCFRWCVAHAWCRPWIEGEMYLGGEDAGLHFRINWAVESMGSVGDVVGNRVYIFTAVWGCILAWIYQGCIYYNPIWGVCHSIDLLKEYAREEGVSAGFGVDFESVSDLSHGIRVSETAEFWEKVQRTSVGPHVDLVPGGNGTGMCLMRADTWRRGTCLKSLVSTHFCGSSLTFLWP